MVAERDDVRHDEAGLLAVLDEQLGARDPAAGEDLGEHELGEAGQLEGQLLAAFDEVVRVVTDRALDGHPAVLGQHVEAVLEEVVETLESEVFDGLDRHDPVDGGVELLPALQADVEGAVGLDTAEQLLAVGLLILRQGQADHVHVVLLHGPLQGQAPAAADLQQGHARLEIQMVQVQVDVGDLGLAQRDMGSGEIGAAVLAGRVLEQAEEVVGQVVVRLDVLEVRPHIVGFGRFGH